jgi:hypothetical protein
MEGKGLTELLRLVNERVRELGDDSLSADAAFWCECGWPACKDQIQLTLREYELRGAPLLAPGHTAKEREPLPLSTLIWHEGYGDSRTPEEMASGLARPTALRRGA